MSGSSNRLAGHPRQAQICETCGEDGEPNLTTSAKVETAVTSDADAVEPILADLAERDRLPDELLADAGYGGHDNVERAQGKDVTLTAPVPGGKEFDPDEVGYDEFELNEAGEVAKCPAGHAPKSTCYNAKNDHVWARSGSGVVPRLSAGRRLSGSERQVDGRSERSDSVPLGRGPSPASRTDAGVP